MAWNPLSWFRWRPFRKVPLPIVVACILMLLLLWIPLSSLMRMSHDTPFMLRQRPSATQVSPAPLIEPLDSASHDWSKGLPLFVGLHIENVYELSLKDKTFSADGRIWLQWDELMQQKKIDPGSLIDFVNQVEDWNGRLIADTQAPVYRNGTWHQAFRFSQKFFLHRLDLRRYPFNDLKLPITLQVNPAFSRVNDRPLVFRPIIGQHSIIGEYANLDGYQLSSAELLPQLRTYRTDYGLMEVLRVSQVEALLSFGHGFWPAFISDVFPLVIILLVVLVSPCLEGSLGDVRIAIPSTALLTLVFLQQGYSAGLPPSPYLTYLDRLYAVSYLICLSLFVLFAWSSNLYERTAPDRREQLVRRLDVYDRNFPIIALIMLAVVSLEAWLY
jgi:hypothetical protein